MEGCPLTANGGESRGSGGESRGAGGPWRPRGIFVPVTTPFIDEDISLDNLERNVQMWLISPVSGFTALDGAGESPHLTFEEKIQVIETTVRAAEGRPVIAATGSDSTLETVALTLVAADKGARAVLVGAPRYYDYGGERMHDALLDHFTEVADASPVPVIIDGPTPPRGPAAGAVSAAVAPSMVEELARHENIAGLKDSSGDAVRFGEYAAAALDGAAAGGPGDFVLLTGSAGAMMSALDLGAAGGILDLAAVAPWECCELYELLQDGRRDEAAALQRRLTRVNEKVVTGYGVAGIKALLDMLGYFGGPPRRPLPALTDEELDDIRMTLRDVRMLGC